MPTELATDSENMSSATNSSDSSVHVPAKSDFDWPQDVEGLCFVMPSRGIWHVAAEHGTYSPCCSTKQFKPHGVSWARGHTEATQASRRFCALCRSRMPSDLRDAILASML